MLDSEKLEKPSSNLQVALSSLGGFIVISSISVAALLARAPPHPPAQMGPLIGTSIALAFVFMPLLWWRHRAGYAGSVVVGILGIVLYLVGPLMDIQSFLAEEIAALPAIMVGSVLSVVIVISSVAASREKS